MKNKKMISKIIIGIALLLVPFLMTGCTDAETVSYNISKDADMFRVKRRITFINLRSDEFLFTITGNCSIQDGESNELDIICRIGDRKYQKHMLKNANETTYVIEQLEYSDVSKYDYEIVFRPKAIIPIRIETETKGD